MTKQSLFKDIKTATVLNTNLTPYKIISKKSAIPNMLVRRFRQTKTKPKTITAVQTIAST